MSEKTSKRLRGLGFIYQRGDLWWIQYSVRGKRYRESVGRDEKGRPKNEAAAVNLLKQKIRDVGNGKPVGPDVDKTTMGELAKILTDEYKANGRRASVIVSPLAHLTEYFGEHQRVIDITSDRVTAYIAKRQEQKAANGTINRSLAALKRAFVLAQRAGKVTGRPHIAMLEENNARSGFLSHAEFERLRHALPDDLKDPVAFLYYSGWRVSEMRALEWRDVDTEGRALRLRPENSKSKKGRVLPLRGELAEIIDRAETDRIPECSFVFHRDNRKVGLFRKSWATACTAAGLGAMLVHDLRRTAVRNLIRAGVSEKTAMSISGHKTRAIFDRYDIVTEDDLATAIERVGEHLTSQPKTATNVVQLKAGVEKMPAPRRADAKKKRTSVVVPAAKAMEG
jgi:integrase